MATKGEASKLDRMQADIQSLTFDSERVIKPAIKDIRDILGRDVYVTKAAHEDLKRQVEDQTEQNRNYPLVEKIVFGLVGFILITVVGAIVYLVVNRGGA